MNDTMDAAGAFEALDDGTRVAILRALAQRQAETPTDPALSFSALRERVGTEDSGRFNYHLGKLRGQFVEKTDDGYELTIAGQKVASSVLAGAYDIGQERDPVDLEADCRLCGDPLEATYADGLLTVDCGNGHGFNFPVPPGAFEGHDTHTVVRSTALVTAHEMELAAEGVCPFCRGAMSVEARATDDVLDVDQGLPPYMGWAVCDRCGVTMTNHVGGFLTRHPAVVSLFYEHGIDVRERPLWELEFVVEDPTVVSTDPLRLRVDVEVGGDAVALTVDDAVRVVAVE
jgi:DNA-binding transcriptional ArsR family regulator